MAHDNCYDCRYHSKATDTCDYILIEDELRGCPAGAGCFRKMTNKEFRMGKTQKWDREKGRELWLQGKTDKEIAANWGVHPDAIGQVRRAVWEKEPGAPKKVYNKKPKTEKPTPVADPVEPVTNCHENTTVKPTGILDAVAIVVKGKTGMAAAMIASAIMAMHNDRLDVAQDCIKYLLDKECNA